MSVTTLDAKYQANRHTAGSPVPGNLADFVEYRRSDAVLDPNAPQSRPDTGYNNYASELSMFLIHLACEKSLIENIQYYSI